MLVHHTFRHTKYWFAGLLITVMVSGCSDSKEITPADDPDNQPAVSNVQQQADPAMQQLGQKVIAFEHQLYDIEGQAIGISEKAAEEIQATLTRRPDFDILMEAERTYLQIADSMQKLPIPEGLSTEDANVLMKAREDYSNAFKAKARAMDAVMLFAVNKNEEAAYKLVDESKLGEELVHQAVFAVNNLQVKLGVDFTQKKDYVRGNTQPSERKEDQVAAADNSGKTDTALANSDKSTPMNPQFQLPEAVLKKGAKGEAVKQLQEALLLLGEQLPVGGADGSFGEGTAEALRSFQHKNGLSADGVYGAATRKVLQEMIQKLTQN